MNFEFTTEQELFREQVRKTLQAACPLQEVRAVLESGAPYSRSAWEALVALGVAAARIPENYGGLGLRYYELCIAAEEVGRTLAPTPLCGSVFLAAEAIMLAGSDAQKSEWLPDMASGRLIGTFADGASPDRALSFSRGRITGRCGPIEDTGAGGLAILLADEHGAPALVGVRLDQPGVVRRRQATVDPTIAMCELSFDAVDAQRLGAPGEGASHADEVKLRAAALTAFEQVGGAQRALDMARDHALQRRTFGQLIGAYQAIKHKLARIYVKVEIARAHAYYGAWALSTDAPDLPIAAAAARASATEAFSIAAQENIQIHGGVGCTWESNCQLFYRRARQLALRLGSSLEWKERLVRELEQQHTPAELPA